MKINIIKSKTRKRSIQISINKDREITVKAPYKTSDRDIEKFIQNHKEWIEKTLQKTPEQGPSLLLSNKIRLLGIEYPLNFKVGRIPKGIIPNKKPVYKDHQARIYFFNEQFILESKITLDVESVKTILQKFYKKYGKNYSVVKSKEYADLIGKIFNRISIKDVSTRWGSCSTKNNLNYNYRLFMAPKEVVDYVIAHEVAHLMYRNHKKEFWDLVEQIYPNYKVNRKWLKKNGHLLTL